MHLQKTIGIAFWLATSTLANPVVQSNQKEGQTSGEGEVESALQAKVQGTIDQWLSDINTVNNFVDTVGNVKDPGQISQMASTAFKAAQNEGTSNTNLQQDVQLGSQGQAAADALVGQFNIIGPAINDTISNPSNVQKNLDAINGARCPPPVGNNAIAQEGQVQAAAASAVGINTQPPALPLACNA